MAGQIQKKQKNYLDYFPFHNTAYKYTQNEAGEVIVIRHNKGIMNKMAHFIFGRPEVSYIRLDDMGSFVWGLMDGQKNVYDIALEVKEEYGQAAEPLYDRLVQYMVMLSEYGIIKMKK